MVVTGRGARALFCPLSLLLLSFAVPASAAPKCELRGQPFLEGRVRGAASKLSRAVDARAGQEIEVFLIMPGLLDGKPVIFGDDEDSGRRSFSKSGCGPLTVTWRRIEPLMAHKQTPAPNPNLSVYANAVIFGPKHGKWLGYDRIEYSEKVVASDGTNRPLLVVRDARPSEMAAPRKKDHEGLGIMRLSATVRLGDQELATPGAPDGPGGLIADQVFRYTFRSGDGFIGWLTSYFNVPYLFGSAGDGVQNQAERYVGADCADVLVAALRRAGLRRLRYTNVGGVIDALGKTAGPSLVQPCPGPVADACAQVADPPLRFGSDVRPGDILALGYPGADELPRSLDHIVVLVEDRGPGGVPDGVLGPQDLVVDTGDEHGLKFAPLGDQGTARVVVARPKGVPVL